MTEGDEILRPDFTLTLGPSPIEGEGIRKGRYHAGLQNDITLKIHLLFLPPLRKEGDVELKQMFRLPLLKGE
jgi:hypothetical protein